MPAPDRPFYITGRPARTLALVDKAASAWQTPTLTRQRAVWRLVRGRRPHRSPAPSGYVSAPDERRRGFNGGEQRVLVR
jgi:hypothetical protein